MFDIRTTTNDSSSLSPIIITGLNIHAYRKRNKPQSVGVRVYACLYASFEQCEGFDDDEEDEEENKKEHGSRKQQERRNNERRRRRRRRTSDATDVAAADERSHNNGLRDHYHRLTSNDDKNEEEKEEIMANEMLCSSKTVDGCEACVTTMVSNHQFCLWFQKDDDDESGAMFCGFSPKAAATKMMYQEGMTVKGTDTCTTTSLAVPLKIQGEEDEGQDETLLNDGTVVKVFTEEEDEEEDMSANAQIDTYGWYSFKSNYYNMLGNVKDNQNDDYPLHRVRSYTSPKPKWKIILYEPSQELQSSNHPTRIRDFDIPITMPVGGGTTLGIYVTLDSSDLKYTNGNELGGVYAQDDHIMLLEGTGVGHYPLYSDDRFFSPRVFNGDVRYTVKEKKVDGGGDGEKEFSLTGKMNVFG